MSLILENESLLCSQIVEAVEQVERLEEWETIKRIPDDLRGQSFFGEYDFWLFQTIEPSDDRICFACTVLDKIIFTGLELRGAMPYLQIIDGNTILAGIHPNCRCKLLRITNPLDYIYLMW